MDLLPAAPASFEFVSCCDSLEAAATECSCVRAPPDK